MHIDYRYIVTCPAIFRLITLVFSILAYTFARSAENPYYAVNSVIKFDSIALAATCFSAITLLLVLGFMTLRDSIKWLRNELLIQCALIIVYVYGCATMVPETINCHHAIQNGCPRLLTAMVAGIAAVITYIADSVYKLREFRRRVRAERIASSGDASNNIEDAAPNDVDADVD